MRTRPRSRLGKVYASGVISILLLLQCVMIFPPGAAPRNWHWPFIDYPMYSAPHHRGDIISSFELRAQRCARSDPGTVVDDEDFRLTTFVFRRLLQQALEPHQIVWKVNKQAEDYLLELAATHLHDVCAVEIWEITTVLDRRRVTEADAVRQLRRRWDLRPTPVASPGETAP